MSFIILLAIIAGIYFFFKKFDFKVLLKKRNLVKGNDETETKKGFKFKVGPFIVTSLLLGAFCIVIQTMSFNVSVIVFAAFAYLLSNMSIESLTNKMISFFERLDENRKLEE